MRPGPGQVPMSLCFSDLNTQDHGSVTGALRSQKSPHPPPPQREERKRVSAQTLSRTRCLEAIQIPIQIPSFFALFIILIFSHLYGVLNVDKKNN